MNYHKFFMILMFITEGFAALCILLMLYTLWPFWYATHPISTLELMEVLVFGVSASIMASITMAMHVIVRLEEKLPEKEYIVRSHKQDGKAVEKRRRRAGA